MGVERKTLLWQIISHATAGGISFNEIGTAFVRLLFSELARRDWSRQRLLWIHEPSSAALRDWCRR